MNNYTMPKLSTALMLGSIWWTVMAVIFASGVSSAGSLRDSLSWGLLVAVSMAAAAFFLWLAVGFERSGVEDSLRDTVEATLTSRRSQPSGDSKAA